ncbi:UNVERIFIED_CONTAM: hypothetical protein GTU68_044228 [Idotea baltica]|nr:hypothetical protein [Idotea baltica]
MKTFVVVIPARLASTRLHNKPLIDILGKSLLERTWSQVVKAVDSSKVFVLTDDELILKHCQERGMQVVLTSSKCLTGTDRVAEFASKTDFDYYVNVQGDEPIINPDDIVKVIENIHTCQDEIINGYASIDSIDDYKSLTIPKVVFRPDGRLLYMSRSPIPGNKQSDFVKAWRQICIYAFPKESLMAFASSKTKTILENEEDIEILRFLELGYEVKMIPLSKDSIAVDTPEDVDKVIKYLKKIND